MFNIGDKIVYPMHGAGIIEAIEEHNVLGELHIYYVLRICFGGLKVLVPAATINESGVRTICTDEKVTEVFDILKDKADVLEDNWSKRYRFNMEKIKSGNICFVAEVVRNLMWRNHSRGLSAGEKKMLDYARQILISELMLAESKTEVEIIAIIEGTITYKPQETSLGIN